MEKECAVTSSTTRIRPNSIMPLSQFSEIEIEIDARMGTPSIMQGEMGENLASEMMEDG